MAYESDSLNRRTLGPAIASAAIGIALGAVAVAGVSIISGQDSVPSGNTVVSDEALLGGPEYGSRDTVQTAQTGGEQTGQAEQTDRGGEAVPAGEADQPESE